MSLQCPKCNGVVYDRRSSKCGFCGAELPADFKFTDTEAAAASERLRIPKEVPVPRFPTSSVIVWLATAVGWGYLAVTATWHPWWHPWVDWLLAAGYLYVAVEALIRYARQKRQYESQGHRP